MDPVEPVNPGRLAATARRRLGLFAPAILSGLLLSLAFPPLGWWWLAWVALVPVYGAVITYPPAPSRSGKGSLSSLTALASRRGLRDAGAARGDSRGFKIGFFVGLTLHLVGAFWMNEIGAGPWFVLACIEAVPFALLFALCAALLPRLPASARPYVFAALWTLFEVARSYGRYAWPWFLLGASQVRALPMVQVVSVTGQWGLTFAVALVNGLLVEAWRARRRGGPLAAAAMAQSVCLVSALYLGGVFVMAGYTLKAEDGLPVRTVAVAQGNIRKSVDPTEADRQDALQTYLQLTRTAAAGGKPDFILWPETVVPGYLLRDPVLYQQVSGLAREIRVPLLVGAVHVDDENRWWNRAVLFDRGGIERARYDKTQLVPIGEFFPLRGLLGPFYARYDVPESDFSTGVESGVFVIGEGPPPAVGSRVGTLICYENVFPRLARARVRDGAQALILLTSNQSLGETAGPIQHGDLDILRAVETRRYLVRAATTGVSQIIDPAGRTRGSLALGKRGILTGAIALRTDRSLFVRAGDWFLWLCGAILVGGVVIARRSAATTAAQPSDPDMPPASLTEDIDHEKPLNDGG